MPACRAYLKFEEEPFQASAVQAPCEERSRMDRLELSDLWLDAEVRHSRRL